MSPERSAMKTKLVATVSVIFVLCLLAGSALSMSSTNYRLDWFIPLVGSGGPANSTHYAINFTVGQTAIGAVSSSHYNAGLGYWYGSAQRQYHIYLPITLRE
jgi:hypothetical protein